MNKQNLKNQFIGRYNIEVPSSGVAVLLLKMSISGLTALERPFFTTYI